MTTYYINYATGSNSNSGTSPDSPWKNAPGDINATKNAASVNLVGGDEVLFAGGVVYQGAITIKASGTAGNPIIYEGSGWGGQAILSGQTTLSLNFTTDPNNPNLSVATLPAAYIPNMNSVVSIDGNISTTSNTSTSTSALFTDSGPSGSVLTSEITGSGSSWAITDAQLTTELKSLDPSTIAGMSMRLFGYPNIDFNLTITGFNAATGAVTLSGGYTPNPAGSTPASYVLFNNPAFISASNSYSEYAVEGNQIFAAVTPGVHSVAVSTQSIAITDNGHSNVTISGFDITGYGGVYGQGVDVLNAQNITITGNTISDLTSAQRNAAISTYNINGLTITGNNVNSLTYGRGIGTEFDNNANVSNNIITDPGFTAIDVYGDTNSTFSGNNITNALATHSEGIAIYDIIGGLNGGLNVNDTISNNIISGTNGAGITLEGYVSSTPQPNNLVVSDNIISNASFGIADWGLINNALITGNLMLASSILSSSSSNGVTFSNNIMANFPWLGSITPSEATFINNVTYQSGSVPTGNTIDTALANALQAALTAGSGSMPTTMTVAIAVPLEPIGAVTNVLTNMSRTLSDAAAAIDGLTFAQIVALPSIGIVAASSTDVGLTLTAFHALAFSAANIALSSPKGAVNAIQDTAAYINALSATQIASLANLNIGEITAIDTGLTLSLAQISAFEALGVVFALPSGATNTVEDTAANIDALSVAQITELSNLHVTQIVATVAAASLSVIQVAAFKTAGITLSTSSGAYTAANTNSLTATQIASLLGIPFSLNTAVAITVDQASALATIGGSLTPSSSKGITLSDTATNIGSMTAAQIIIFASMGISVISSTSGPIGFTLAQALALESVTPSITTKNAILSISASAIGALTTAQISGLSNIGLSVVISGTGLTFTAAQAALYEATNVTVATGSATYLIDTAANINSLTAAQITALSSLNVTQISATDVGLSLTSAQAAAVISSKIPLTLPAGNGVSIVDTAANIEALSNSQFSGLFNLPITSLKSTDVSLALNITEAATLEAQHIIPSVPVGATVSILDNGWNIQSLTTPQIAALAGLNVTKIAANSSLTLTFAQVSAFQTANITLSPLPGASISLSYTPAAISGMSVAQIASLATTGVTGIWSIGAGVTLSAAQAQAFVGAGAIVNAPAGLTNAITDTAANIQSFIATQIASLPKLNIGQIISTNAVLNLTVGQAVTLLNDKISLSLSSGASVAITDTAANINALTPTQFAAIGAFRVTSITATDASLSITANDAVVLEANHTVISVPAGATVTLADNAWNIQSLTTAQIAGLSSINVTQILITNSSSMTLTATQAAALSSIGPLTLPTGSGVYIADTAANIEALSTSQFSGMFNLPILSLKSTDASLAFNIAEASTLEAKHIKLSVPVSATVSILDSALNVDQLTTAQIAALAGLGVSRVVLSTSNSALSLAQVSAFKSANITLSPLPGTSIFLSDTPAAISGMSVIQIVSLATTGVTGILPIGGGVTLSVAQAQAFAGGGAIAAGPANAIKDTAANIQSFIATQIASLANLDIGQIISTDASLNLTAAQAVMLINDKVSLSLPSGASVAITDTAANLKALTSAQFAALSNLHVAQIAATGDLCLTASQAAALSSTGIPLALPAGNGVSITDTAANIEALSNSQFSGLFNLPITSLKSTDVSLALNLTEAATLEVQHIIPSVPVGSTLMILDSASNVDQLTVAQIAALAGLGVSKVVFSTNNSALSIAQVSAFQIANITLSPLPGTRVFLSDTPAAISGMSVAQIVSMVSTGVNGILPIGGGVTLSVAQAQAFGGGAIAAGPANAIKDTAANIQSFMATQIASLANLDIGQITSTDAGLKLTAGQAVTLINGKISLSLPSGASVTITDTAANLNALTPAQFAAIGSFPTTSVTATDASLSITANDAIILEANHIALSVPVGATVTLADTAANIEALSNSQFSGMFNLPVLSLKSTDTSLALNIAEAANLVAQHIIPSVPVGATVTVLDSASNVDQLTVAQIAALAGLGVSKVVLSTNNSSLSLAQVSAFKSANIILSPLPGTVIFLSDTPAAISGMSVAQIVSLVSTGVTGILPIGAGVTLSAAQAQAFAGAIAGGPANAIKDTAANIQSFMATQIASLANLDIGQITSTDAGLKLTAGQAVTLINGKISLSLPSGASVTITDTAANLNALTSAQFAALSTLHVTQIAATGGGLSLSAAQAAAVISSGIPLTLPSGNGVSINDTAANIEALSTSQFLVLFKLPITSLKSTDVSLALNITEAATLEAQHIIPSVPVGATVSILDNGWNIQSLTTAQIAALVGLNVTKIAANSSLNLTVAQVSAFQTANIALSSLPGASICLSDTPAAIGGMSVTQIASLATTGVTGILPISSGVTLSAAQAQAFATVGVTAIVSAGLANTIKDTAANIQSIIATQIASLPKLNIGQIVSTNAVLNLTAGQAVTLLNDKISLSLSSGASVAITDTAANINALTPAQFAAIGAFPTTSVTSTDASLSITANDAVVFEANHTVLSVPAGATVTLADNAWNIQSLTTAQIAGLVAIGVHSLYVTNANTSFTVAETTAIISAGLTLNAASGYTSTENFANGNYSVYQNNQLVSQKSVNSDGSYTIANTNISGQPYGSDTYAYNGSGAETAFATDSTNGNGSLTVYGNGVTVSVGPSQLSVTSSVDTFSLNAHVNETVTAASSSNDAFLFSPASSATISPWHDTVTDFNILGTSHETLQFSASAFGVTSGQGASVDVAALLNHTADSAFGAVITDNYGDSVTLSGVNKASLSLPANAGDFKFI